MGNGKVIMVEYRYKNYGKILLKVIYILALTQDDRGVVNNTGADQPAHPGSLISALVIAFWKVPYVNLLLAKFQFSSWSL